MGTSNNVFDRVDAALTQPFVLGQMAGIGVPDVAQARRLVRGATVALVSGLADRMAEFVAVRSSGRGLSPMDLASWQLDRLDRGLPDATRCDGWRAARVLLGARYRIEIRTLADNTAVAGDVVEQALAAMAPVVATAALELGEELGLREAELARRLQGERLELVRRGLTSGDEDSNGMDPDQPVTRNVAKVRVARGQNMMVGAGIRRPRANGSINRTWLWWSVVVVLAIVLVALVVAPNNRETEANAGGPPPLVVATA